MAHRLSIRQNGRVEMAYVGETPWHALGVNVASLQSARDMLTHASMDWPVVTEPVYMSDGNGGYIAIPDKSVILRGDTRYPFDIASDHYNPIQNAQNADTLDAIIANGATVETMGAIDNGARCWALARIPKTFEVVSGDTVDTYILLTWGHDGKHGVSGYLTGIRVVCANTLNMATSGKAGFSVRHSKNAEVRMEDARQALGLVYKEIEDTAATFKRLAEVPMPDGDSRLYLEQVFPYPAGVSETAAQTLARLMGAPVGELEQTAREAMQRVDEVRDICNRLMGSGKGSDYAPGTLWNAYNAVTEYTDHVYPVLQSGQVSATKQQAVLFGATAKVKARALDVAVSMASA